MKSTLKASLVIPLYLLLSIASASAAQEPEALKGVKSAKAIFDVRIGNPKSAALHLKLIHQTFKGLAAAKKQPVFVVVFLGPSVKLISKNREGFAPEDLKALDEIAEVVTAMSKDGIGLEICLIAARVFNVDPATVWPEIRRVENGWFSVIGYQAQGYALVPAY
jgi:intracellular sulfur oxidation DsrE/DsrF family protein